MKKAATMEEAATATSNSATGDAVAAELLQSSVWHLVMMRQSTTIAVMLVLEDSAGGVREQVQWEAVQAAATAAFTAVGPRCQAVLA